MLEADAFVSLVTIHCSQNRVYQGADDEEDDQGFVYPESLALRHKQVCADKGERQCKRLDIKGWSVRIEEENACGDEGQAEYAGVDTLVYGAVVERAELLEDCREQQCQKNEGGQCLEERCRLPLEINVRQVVPHKDEVVVELVGEEGVGEQKDRGGQQSEYADE